MEWGNGNDTKAHILSPPSKDAAKGAGAVLPKAAGIGFSGKQKIQRDCTAQTPALYFGSRDCGGAFFLREEATYHFGQKNENGQASHIRQYPYRLG